MSETRDLPKSVMALYADAFAAVSDRDLNKLKKLVVQEKAARYADRLLSRRRTEDGYRAMANFMSGVTWAMACRASLRASKGHEPMFGKRPAAGNMWLPRELLTAVRHQVKELGWHPITSVSADVVIQNLKGQEASARAPKNIQEDRLHAVQFAVRMAAPTYAAVRSKVDDRFDYGGES